MQLLFFATEIDNDMVHTDFNIISIVNNCEFLQFRKLN